MTYSIKWHPQSLKVLEKLPKSIIQRVFDKWYYANGGADG